MRTLGITRFGSPFDRFGRREDVSFPELITMLSEFKTREDKERLPAWSPATFEARKPRCIENVERVSCFVMDMDGGFEPKVFARMLEPYAHVIHSSFSHTSDYPKWRLVMPLAFEVWPQVWNFTWAKLISYFSRGLADRTVKDASRIYFLPACPPERRHMCFSEAHGGEWLDPDTLPDEIREVPLPLYAQRFNAEHSTPSMLVPTGAPPERGDRLDMAAVAAGEIADGQKHNTLIRTMFLMRRQGHDRATCEALIEASLNSMAGRLKRPIATELAIARREIERTWAKISTDAEDAARSGARG